MPVEIDILRCRKCGFESLVDEPPCGVCGRQMANRDLLDVRVKLEKAEESMRKIHDRAGDRPFVFFESAAFLEDTP